MAHIDHSKLHGAGGKRTWTAPELVELKFEKTAGKYNVDTVERTNQTIPYAPS